MISITVTNYTPKLKFMLHPTYHKIQKHTLIFISITTMEIYVIKVINVFQSKELITEMGNLQRL